MSAICSKILSKNGQRKTNLMLYYYEPAHDKTYNKICVISEDSDKPAHPCSLIRVFADRMCFLQPPVYPQYWLTT